MQTAIRTAFTTIKTEGALLPADLLQRVADRRDVEGLAPADYHLAANERLNEAINRSWSRLLGAWAGFQAGRERLAPNDAGTTLTRERWLLILFQELGYGRLPTARGLEVEGQSYPISHLWERTPIHLVTFRQDLDRRGEFTGAVRRSPHSLMQEFLNRSEGYLWGLVSNGLRLRLLRDNASLTRAAYVEFDLESMMQGELYAEFALLWMVCHQSRVETADGAADCWLERWSKSAAESGARALDTLRQGVQEAIEALGRGFIAHPANADLRQRLKSGALSVMDYNRQLLRMVYRLIFICAAEDRDLLLTPEATPEARQRYAQHYSLRRLRDLAGALRGGPHADLYRALRLLFQQLQKGYPPLGLPALGSYLFSQRATPDLDAADLANEALLGAVRALAYTIENSVRRPVDYRNLGAEELGSVYESLLELHPQINVDAVSYALSAASGSERKTTGSYYTPSSLIQCLLDSALEPVIAERMASSGGRAVSGGQKTNSEWRMEHRGRREGGDDTVVSGPRDLAARHGARRAGVSSHQELSQRGAFRPDVADPSRGDLDPGQHRRGLGAERDEGVPALFAHRPGQSARTGDASPSQSAGATLHQGPDSAPARDGQHPGQTNPDSDAPPPPPTGLAFGHSPLAAHHSPDEAALLSIRVCDPACGSGAFLIAAAHRLARHLARLRSGDEEPAPAALRAALRDVVRHCIYGVDLNEMAVELCKVALWMETLDPGKPLSFLDANIQCGNSLIGATPELIALGLPDEAFAPLTGDDKTVCSEFKKKNKREREGQGTLFDDALRPWERLGNLAQSMAAFADLEEDTLGDVGAKQELYEEMVRSQGYEYNRLLADAWCAAFVWKKVKAFDYPITTEVLRQLEHNPFTLAPWMKAEIQRLAAQYRFFHWHLAFPQVFGVSGGRRMASGGERMADGDAPFTTGRSPLTGFDVALGNPPWERVKLQEKEWFAARRPEIAQAPNAAARRKLIAALAQDDPDLYAAFQEDLRQAEGESQFLRASARYPLCGRGDVNTYAVFAELTLNLIAPQGRAGIIVPTGIATDDTTKLYFQAIMEQSALVSLYDFENRAGLFPAVDSRMKFCLLTLRGTASGEERMANGHSPLSTLHSPPAEFAFFAHRVEDLADPARRFTLGADEIALLNPNTRTCPIFRSQRDAALTKAIYRRVPVLLRDAPPSPSGRGAGGEGAPFALEQRAGGDAQVNPWGIKFATMFHMSNDSALFRTRAQLEAEGWRLEGNVMVNVKSQTSNVTPDASRLTPDVSRLTPDVPRYLPLYEAKLMHQFDHRWATYDGDDTRDLTPDEKADPARLPLPRYWAPEGEVRARLAAWEHGWLLGFRDITNTTNERTAIFGLLPRAGVGHKAPLVMLNMPTTEVACFLSCMCSFVLDYVARQSVGGTSMAYFILKQLPVLPPTVYGAPCPWQAGVALGGWVAPRALELTYTAWDLAPFAQDCGYDGPPFRWDEERRFLLRCELDAAFFHLYGIAREDVEYIMGTFPIVQRKDEAAWGEYRTRRVILKIYDALARAQATGQPYQTLLDPPPADPRIAHGWETRPGWAA